MGINTAYQPSQISFSGDSVTFVGKQPHTELGTDNNLSEHWKTKGNQAHYERRYGDAANAYKKAVRYQPGYADAWFNLGHTYINLGKPDEAIDAFSRLLKLQPNDHEARINLVEQLVGKQLKHQAIGHLEYILREEPGFDPAKRLDGLYRLQHWAHRTGYQYGQQYQQVLQQLGQWNMAKARKWLVQYVNAHPELNHSKPLRIERILSNNPPVRYVFAPTTQIDNVSNLAEYDHHPKDGNPVPIIRFAPEMAFAHPAVLAAYWLHEGIHAEDVDGITSIAEEQHAYREKTKFWAWSKIQSIGIDNQPQPRLIDPNLDYALQLYKTNPKELDNKVALHYKMRDPSITSHSPGHAPKATMPSSPTKSTIVETAGITRR